MTKISIDPEKGVHLMTTNELREKFDVDLSKGLSSVQAKKLLAEKLKSNAKLSYVRILKSILKGQLDFFSFLLWFDLIVTILLIRTFADQDGPALYNIFVICIILINILFKSILIGIQEFRLIRMIRSLELENMTPVTVLRNSELTRIPACELVIGDIVEINMNERVPADLRLFMVNDLRLDKSISTGEIEPVEAQLQNLDKNVKYQDSKNMAFNGFLVLTGCGRGLVVSFGNQKLFDTAANKKRFDPIRKGINQLAIVVALLSLINVIVFIIMTANSDWKDVLAEALDTFVSLIPIGIPLTLTIGLFLINRELGKLNIMVKNIFSINSTMNIDVVLTDKTGTLTRNAIEVSNVFYSAREVNIDICLELPGVYLGAPNGLKDFLDLCDFCSAKDVANILERRLFEFARKNRPLQSKPLVEIYKIINEIEFNSRNRYHVKLVSAIKDYSVLMIRGAHDTLLPKCQYLLAEDGNVVEMDSDRLRAIQDKIDEWSLMGRRLICFCKKIIANHKNTKKIKSLGKYDFQHWLESEWNNMTFVGLVGFIDPPKPDTKESIAKMRAMGVRVVMVTGDYSLTAISIARQVGILADSGYDTYTRFREKIQKGSTLKKSLILNGQEIEKLAHDEWKSILKSYAEIVLSRAKPNYKLICVKQFQANGSSVLMVGDGLNDLPALKQSDLSVAMFSGCKLTLNMSSIILLNNSFSSISEMIATGRQALLNIKKILIYSIIPCVLSNFISRLLSSTIGIPYLYTDLQMAIISAFTDVVGAVSLFFERPEPKELKRPVEKLINIRFFLMSFLILGPLTTFLTYVNYFAYFKFYASWTDLFSDHGISIMEAQSIVFYSIVVMQTFGNLYSLRTRRLLFVQSLPITKLYRNLYLIIASLFVFVLIALIVSFKIPYFVVPIPVAFYFIPLGCSLFIFIFNEIRKACLARFNWTQSILTW